MINPEILQDMSTRLKIYDIDQTGWEHEAKGPVANFSHVLLHLAKNLSKDFSNRQIVAKQIAPDALKHALRLGRWTAQDAEDLLPTEELIREMEQSTQQYDALRSSHRAHVGAVIELSQVLHDLDHTQDASKQAVKLADTARKIGGTLIYAADQQAHTFGFDLEVTFDDRLAVLRSKAGIKQPPRAGVSR